jgi:hypothetical protein
MKFAHIENNKILGWYDKAIHSVIPTPNVEVTDEQWLSALAINANTYANGVFSYVVETNPEQVKANRIIELKSLLKDSDYKVLSDYDKPNDAIKAQRQAWRVEIRSLEDNTVFINTFAENKQ